MQDNNNPGGTRSFYSTIVPQPNDAPEIATVDRSRPTSITVICVLIVLGVILNATQLPTYLSIFSDVNWFKAVLVVNLLLASGAAVLLLMMRKWGAWLYTANFLLSVGAYVGIGAGFPILFMIVPLIVQALIYSKYNLMR